MKNSRYISMLTGLFGITSTVIAADAVDRDTMHLQKVVYLQRLAQLAAQPVDPNLLEPCMNGGVSASGLYTTQAEEDSAMAEAPRLSWAMGGQVSASGR